MKSIAGSRVAVGNAVIVSMIDRPCVRLVAIVTEVASDRIVARYLAKSVAIPWCWGIPAEVTPVEQFGVRVVYHPASGLFWTVPHGQSEAKYKDGQPRTWQDQPDARESARGAVIGFATVEND